MTNPITDLPLFADTGRQLKEAGCARVLGNNPSYAECFESAAADILRRTGSVTSDEVVAEIGMPDGSPNAVGAAMRAAARSLSLRVDGYRKSTRPSCHAAIVAVWRAA